MLDERIKPIPHAGCWIWMGSLDSGGYGRRVEESRDSRPAHKVFWERENGPAPTGLCVLHKCDVQSCVNPDHLYLGTKTQNAIDRVVRNRQGRGERYRNSKLRNVDIPKIRADSRSHTKIAADYGVSRQLISMVKRYKIWTHVDG